jgi:3-dehydroquinate synthetase
VICGIAGFVASTYNRGMPLALVLTTAVGIWCADHQR